MNNLHRALAAALVVASAGARALDAPAHGAGAKAGAAAKATAATAATPFRLRLRFANTDVSDVLQAIGLHTRANIVFPAQLKRPITLNVTASSVSQALAYATAAAGLVFRQVGETFVVAAPDDLRRALEPFGERQYLDLNGIAATDAIGTLTAALPCLTARPAGNKVLLVGSADDLQQARSILDQQTQSGLTDPPVAVVSPVHGIMAAQAATLLKAMYPALRVEPVGQSDKTGGAVGLVGPKSQVDDARGTLVTLDPPQESAAARTYQVYQAKYTSVGSLLAFLQRQFPNVTAVAGPDPAVLKAMEFRSISATLTSGGATNISTSNETQNQSGQNTPVAGVGQPQASTSRLVVLSGPTDEVDAALKVLADVDIMPRQIMVEVKVVDTSPEQIQQQGIQWSWNPLQFMEYPAGTPLTGTHTDASSPATVGVNPAHFSRVPMNFQGIVSAMVQKNLAKILADPSVQVIDNEDATIFIGDTYRTTVSLASVSGTTVQLVEFPVGIILLVRPRVCGDGRVLLRVHPVVSTITDLSADNLPNTASREAETTVLVNDGETVVIGGLIRDEVSRTVQEVPLLSKLPLVGELFRNRSTDHKHSEILVSITPHILKDGVGTAVAMPPIESGTHPKEKAHG